jgi:hypothetical protein
MDKQSLAQMLADNNLEALFDALKSENTRYLHELLLLESQWNDLRSRQRAGVVSNDHAGLEMARIRKSLLELIEISSGQPRTAYPAVARPGGLRWWIWALLAFTVALVGYVAYTQIQSSPAEKDSSPQESSAKGEKRPASSAKTLNTSEIQPLTLAAGDVQYERVYTLLKTSVESTGGGSSLITLRVGLNFKGIINHLFGNNNFRLVSDELPGPLAPSNFFSTVVDAKSYAEEDVKFELSDDIKRFSVIIEDKPEKKWNFSR